MCRNVTMNVLHALDAMFFTIADDQSVNQSATVIETKMFTATIDRLEPEELASMRVSMQNGAMTVTLPETLPLQDNSSSIYLSVRSMKNV